MDLLDTLNISGAGLSAQRVRLQTVASNLANARTTRTPEGGQYQRRAPQFVSAPIDPFGSELEQALSAVDVADVITYDSPGVRRYEPDHPDADADGFVTYPDIDVLHEMVDLMTAGRSYEANASVVDATRDMGLKALEIGR